MPGSWIAEASGSGKATAAGLRVKVCGITRLEDAEAAVEAGVDALGFNFFAGSKRALRLEDAAEWLREVPTSVVRVAVVVNPQEDLRRGLEESGFFDALQFHGDEEPDFCRQCRLPWWRAFRGAGGPGRGGEPEDYVTPWWLFDAAAAAGTYGGSGEKADWSLVAHLVESFPRQRIFLAGGLTPGNVGAAVTATQPFGVDVAGGVESAPGRKDAALMRNFVQAARAAARPVGNRTEAE
jgi:phosphoribosylanthranilate isomerase